jgi:hypothetical protein
MDWIDQLAKQASKDSSILPKEERKRKREEKKLKKSRQRLEQEERQQHQERGVSSSSSSSFDKDKKSAPSTGFDRAAASSIYRRRIRFLSKRFKTICEKSTELHSRRDKDKKMKKNKSHDTTTMKAPNPKTTTIRHRKFNDNVIQPRASDYSGMGLARQSLCILLSDPSFSARLRQEFLEHIPGFFGKQRTKAMKRQTEPMLWQQALQRRKEEQQIQLQKQRRKEER